MFTPPAPSYTHTHTHARARALRRALAGAPWVTCDIGGFSGQSNPLLLTRWYGVGVFMPIMRVHSTNSATPHFPFPELWGQEASDAMKALLQLRYALLPYTYSLAHEAYRTGVPPARPLALEFPGDLAVAETTASWMLGPALLAAPVLQDDNTTTAYLPLGAAWWFEWGTATTHAGGTTLPLANVPLGAVPVFARAGSIVPLAPPVEWSDALPGGPLRVAVYAGADGAFILAEDDGDTMGYASGAVSTLALAWSEATKCLCWTRGGAAGAGGAQAFTQLSVTAYLLSGAVTTAAAVPIGAGGSACPA